MKSLHELVLAILAMSRAWLWSAVATAAGASSCSGVTLPQNGLCSGGCSRGQVNLGTRVWLHPLPVVCKLRPTPQQPRCVCNRHSRRVGRAVRRWGCLQPPCTAVPDLLLDCHTLRTRPEACQQKILARRGSSAQHQTPHCRREAPLHEQQQLGAKA